MKDYIKFGLGIYIGWQIGDALNHILGSVITNIRDKKKVEENND